VLSPACPTCGAAVEEDWRNCGACGTPLPRVTRHSRLNSPTVLVAAGIVVLILASLAMLGAERRLAQRTDDLAQTRTTLRDTSELLTSVRAELEERVKERDGLRAELDKAKGSLTDAERSVRSQGEQLQTLKECFNAIEDLGQALDEGDDAAAQAAYNRVERECNEAAALL
jgi:septal ring factor EnvC (AmiA/AmiB activator)